MLEKLGVDAEALREPRDRVGGRARLASLDLADVLLREPRARKLGLREPGGDAQCAHALADAAHLARRRRRGSGGRIAHSAVTQAAPSPAALPRWGETGSPVSVLMVKCEDSADHLTELLDFSEHDP